MWHKSQDPTKLVLVTSNQTLDWGEENIKPCLLSFQEISASKSFKPWIEGWLILILEIKSSQGVQMFPMKETSKEVSLCNRRQYNPDKRALIIAEFTSLFIIHKYIRASSEIYSAAGNLVWGNKNVYV